MVKHARINLTRYIVVICAMLLTLIGSFTPVAAQDNTQTVTDTKYYAPLNITSTASITGPVTVPPGHLFNIAVQGSTSASMCNWQYYENGVLTASASLVFGKTVGKTFTPVNPILGNNIYEFWFRGIAGAHNWPDYVKVAITVSISEPTPRIESITPAAVLPTEEMLIQGGNFEQLASNNIVRVTCGEDSVEQKAHWVDQTGTSLKVYAPADLFVGDNDTVMVQVVNSLGTGNTYQLEILSCIEGINRVQAKLQDVINNTPAQNTADLLNVACNALSVINSDTYRRDAFNVLAGVMANMLLAAKSEYDYGANDNKAANITSIYAALNDHICTRAGLISSDFFAFKSKDLAALLSQALDDDSEYALVSQAIEQTSSVQYQLLSNNLNGLFYEMKQLDNILSEIYSSYPFIAEDIRKIRRFQVFMALNLLKAHYNDTINSGVPLDANPALSELGNIINTAEIIDIPTENYGVALDKFIYYADVLIGPNDHPTPPDERIYVKPVYVSTICICGVRSYGIKGGPEIDKPVIKDTGNTYTTCGVKVGLELLGKNNSELKDVDWWYWGCEGTYYKLGEEALVPIGYCKRPLPYKEVTDVLNIVWVLDGAGTLDATYKSAVYTPPPMEINDSVSASINVLVQDSMLSPGDCYDGIWVITVTRKGITDYDVIIIPPENNVGQNPLFSLGLNPCPCGCCQAINAGWGKKDPIEFDDAVIQPTQEKYIPVDIPVVLKSPLYKDIDKLGVLCECSGGSGLKDDLVSYKWKTTPLDAGKFSGIAMGKTVVFVANQPGEITFNITVDDPPDVKSTQANDDPDETSIEKTAIRVEIEKCSAKFEPKGGENDNFVKIKATVTPKTVKGKFKFTLFEVSDEPGYCMNAPQETVSGEDSPLWKDLQFPEQGGFNISGANSNVAETTSSDNTAIVKIKCYDYGAYGKIRAEFIPADAPTQIFCAVEKGGKKCYTNIPLDDDENLIWDGWTGNSTNGSNSPMDDTDENPAGNNKPGDGLTRQEEYRGFMVSGKHVRTNVIQKDVFIRNVDVDDAGRSGFFTEKAFGNKENAVPIHVVTSDECEDIGADRRSVNFNYKKIAHKYKQWAIWVENGFEGGDYELGLSRPLNFPPRPEPMVPNDQLWCYVYVTTIKAGTIINKEGGISANDTIIPIRSITDAEPYRQSGGKIRIENEIISYGGIDNNNFTNCIRGVDGTTSTSHANGTKVSWFINETDKIKHTFAHEAGHYVNLLHSELKDENIMSPTWFGTTLNDGFWKTFIGQKSAITNRFCVKKGN